MATYVHNDLDITTPAQTSDSSPLAITGYPAPTYPAWKAFNHILGPGEEWLVVSVTAGWLKVDLGAGAAKAISAYTVSRGYYADRAPKDWTLQGSNNDTDWTTVNTQTAQTAWGADEMRTYTLGSISDGWRYWKLNITANDGGLHLEVGELELLGVAAGGRNNAMIF